MGIFDSVFDGFDLVPSGGKGRLRRNVRAGERLLAEGSRTTARLTGIRVRPGSDDGPDQHEFRLEFAGPGAAMTVAGCRQQLGTLAPGFRLGMEVPVRFGDDGAAIIDTPALGGGDAWGFKALGEPPAPGIEDPGLGLDKEARKADPVTVEVRSACRSSFFGAAVAGADLRVRVTPAGAAPYEADVRREFIPFYAAHLVAEGTVLPGLARRGKPDRVRIDWPAAAVADPGVGRPAAPIPDPAPAPAPAPMATAAGAQAPSTSWDAMDLAAVEHGDIGGVSFGLWVTVEAALVRHRVPPAGHDAFAEEHGVPAGGWEAARQGWQSAMVRDPRIGAAFGSAYSAALKGR